MAAALSLSLRSLLVPAARLVSPAATRLFFWWMQATATNGLVQRVRQNLYGFGHLWHTLAFIQQRLRFHFHLAFQHRGRPPPRGCEKISPATLPESFHIPLHRHRRYVKRPRNVRLPYRPIDHQLAGEIAKRRHVLLRMLKDGEVSID